MMGLSCAAPKIVLLLVITISSATARGWRDVVDPSLYRWIDLDPQRLIVMAETDPFLISHYPTSAPMAVPSMEDVAARPTISPTVAPTEIWAMVGKNGGCPDDQILHEIRMTDSWGDGWDKATMIITRMVHKENQIGVVQKFETGNQTEVTGLVGVRQPRNADPSYPLQVYNGTLRTGTEGFEYICLEQTECYQVTVGGGLWDQEIAWGIRQVQLGVARDEASNQFMLAKGNAPETCQLSVLNTVSGEQVCPTTCGVRTETPTPVPTTRVPTTSPTLMPTTVPFSSGQQLPLVGVQEMDSTQPPSDAPSMVPSTISNVLASVAGAENTSSAPSDVPSLVPTRNSASRRSDSPSMVPSISPSDAPSLIPTSGPSSRRDRIPRGSSLIGF